VENGGNKPEKITKGLRPKRTPAQNFPGSIKLRNLKNQNGGKG
jgi:hypothetical protein